MKRNFAACWTAIACAAIAATMVSSGSRLAAEEPPAAKAETPAEQVQVEPPQVEPPQADVQSFGDVILQKTDALGWAFYSVQTLFSIAALTIILERLFNLRRGRILPPRFVRKLNDLIARKEANVESLQRLCEDEQAPVAQVLRAGLERSGRPLLEVEKGMEDAAAREVADLRSRHRALGTIASIAPLIGLLGTVVGIMLAFRISSVEKYGRAELLAEGIYLALLTTVYGLLTAIPSLLAAAWFNGRIERYTRDMDRLLAPVLPALMKAEKPVEAAPSKSSAGRVIAESEMY